MNRTEIISALLSASMKNSSQSDDSIIENCPATKKSIREFEFEFEFDALCEEYRIDKSKVDTKLHFPIVSVKGEMRRDSDSLQCSCNTRFKGGTKLTMRFIDLRVDAPSTNRCVTNKYEVWQEEDTLALILFKKAYSELLRSSFFTTSLTDNVVDLRLSLFYKTICQFAAKLAIGDTLRITRVSMEEVVSSLLEEVARYNTALNTIGVKAKEAAAEARRVATAYHAAEQKRCKDKKAQEEAANKARADASEAAKKAEDTALKARVNSDEANRNAASI